MTINNRRGTVSRRSIRLGLILAVLLVYSIGTPTYAFVSKTTTAEVVRQQCPFRFDLSERQPTATRRTNCGDEDYRRHRRRNRDFRWSKPKLHAVAETAAAAAAAVAAAQNGRLLSDYAPAAASLFNNMKLPAAVVTAGMISLGFATRFPELPRDSLDRVYPREIRQRCAKLERLHIVIGLISVTSELIVVLWSAVEVNQLTERAYAPARSVWDLIQRDCDLAWSAVNSHFVMGIIGFVAMLWLRAYVMLLAARASRNLMAAASTGTAAALCLMVSIVNRGVESGGGNAYDRYGNTILDLFQHYAALLLRFATDVDSPGPLQMSAIAFEITSLCFMLAVLLKENAASFEEQVDEDSCPVVDPDDFRNDEEVAKLSTRELEKLKTCMTLEEEEQRRREDPSIKDKEEEKRRQSDDSGYNSSVNIL